MGDCPKPERKLTRFGLCYFYNFDMDWDSGFISHSLTTAGCGPPGKDLPSIIHGPDYLVLRLREWD